MRGNGCLGDIGVTVVETIPGVVVSGSDCVIEGLSITTEEAERRSTVCRSERLYV